MFEILRLFAQETRARLVRRATAERMAKKKVDEFKPEKAPTEGRASTSVELWQVSRLKPYKRNAKSHPPEQVALLAKIIDRHGFDQPIVVDEKGVIIKGHGRWLAAQSLGRATVPVIVRDDLTPSQAAEARIADNRVAEFGWDFDALVADVVGNLKDGLDVDFIGYSLTDLGLEKISNAQPLEEMPVLPSGEKGLFCTMSFMLHESQAALMREALALAKKQEPDSASLNENSNGNAIYQICAAWLKSIRVDEVE